MRHDFIPWSKKFLYTLGILASRQLTGPFDVIIDIEPKCNTKCIMCWFFSPLLKREFRDGYLERTMSLAEFKRNIDSLEKMGVGRVSLIGAGEPLVHPDAIEMAAYVKSKGMMCKIVTNGMLLDGNKTRILSEMGLDEINVSLNSPVPETYAKIHSINPENAAKTIDRIKGHVNTFSSNGCTRVILTHVIMNINYKEIEEMLDFAIETGSDSVFFKFMSYSPPGIKELLLNDEEKEELVRIIDSIPSEKRNIVENNLAELREYYTDGAKPIRETPCYMGWLFSKIMIDGTVIPCCDCFDTEYKKFGNVSEKGFKDIWESSEYDSFRKMSNDYDARIEKGYRCYNCQMATQNMGIDNLLKKFHVKRLMKIFGK